MPNKYSHTVVLAHYSSLGLIDLPNDQYIAYLKTYPTSRPPSHTSRCRRTSSGAQGSITPSTAYSSRYRLFEEPASTPRSATGRREYSTTVRRNVILESDEGSEDEHVILHKTHEPVGPPLQCRKKFDGQYPRTERRKSPSESTYTGRSSSEMSERARPPQNQQHASAQAKNKPKTSSPSIINLNDYETEPGLRGRKRAPARRTEPPRVPSSDLKADPPAAQTQVVDRTAATPSSSQENRPDSPGIQNEPNFDGFVDSHTSELTITGIEQGTSDRLPAAPSRQISKSSVPAEPISSSTRHPLTLPKRVDSAPGFHRSAPREGQIQHNWSTESSSGAGSESERHLTTTPKDVISSKLQKTLRTKSGKSNLAPRDAKASKDAIHPGFLDESGGAPRQTSTSPTGLRLAALYSHPSPSASKPSQQYSRLSSDHAPPNPDFWRGLEEMLSDSDASAAFPPDIAKYKPRGSNASPAAKVDKSPRSGPDDGEMKRPTTAPAPRTSSRDVSEKDEPLPDGRSKITVTNSTSLDKPGANREPTTVQLVDTSPQRKAKKFLTKLRKKPYEVKKG